MKNKKFVFECRRGNEITIGAKKHKIIRIGGDNPLRIVAPFGYSSETDMKTNLRTRINTLVNAGAEMVQELSIFGNYKRIRADLIDSCEVPYGTVLTYEFYDNCIKHKSLTNESIKDILIETLYSQIEDGIDYTTVHASLSYKILRDTSKSRKKRAIPITSRSGSMIQTIMSKYKIDNPLNTYFEEIAKIVSKNNIAISLGSTFRPAAIADAIDDTHHLEIETQGNLTRIGRVFNTSMMLEGLSHGLPMDVGRYVEIARKKCFNIPVTALGPLPLDIAAGMDHIASTIGIIFGALSGLDLVNIVTSKEHLLMPSEKDMLEALRAAKIAVYCAEIMKKGHSIRDLEMSKARRQLDWQSQSNYALFPELFCSLIEKENLGNGSGCTICGKRCPLKIELHRTV